MLTIFDNGFNYVDKFFNSLNNYLNYNSILVVALTLFLLAFIIVLITTANSYEAKLIRAIDMFNNYFMHEPEITAENLLEFNNKMKSRKVPKQLRKQWQQFVLYRDKSASDYMSFEVCVSSPIKNSTYKRDVKILNFVCYILALISIIANLYSSWFESANFSAVLQHVLLCPILLLILNFFITIFFEIRHNAIVSDLNQNYQYFELNIDRAAATIPEYVDYELLFDKNEIKKGIPVLYTYLQRRADEEKRELERARLKNVEHEKFNFDEAGVAKSLVLERAMQEAENYIAERNKFLQDTEQINAEMTQEEMNFREITKEYQREMQVSKETFDNFKAQLNDVSSSIEANYLKKQQQQELDRQRNLERDYDTATERHNQMIKTLQEELDAVNDELKQARASLEHGMMSEFDSYSQKVYADAERVVKERSGNINERQKSEIDELKTQIASLTALNQKLMGGKPNSSAEPTYNLADTQTEIATTPVDEMATESADNSAYNAATYEYQPTNDDYSYTSNNSNYGENQTDDSYYTLNTDYGTESDVNLEEDKTTSEENNALNVVNNDEFIARINSLSEQDGDDLFVTISSDKQKDNDEIENYRQETTSQAVSTKKESESQPKKAGKRGRPRKVKTEPDKPKKPVGRPKKVKTEEELNKPKRGRGRPRKIIIIQEGEPQPEVEETKPENEKKQKAKSKSGKTKNVSVVTLTEDKDIGDIDSYLKEIDNQIAEENAKMEASQKELEKNSRIRKRRK